MVSFIVNAFINAATIFIQILLFVVPMMVFIAIVGFWYKLLAAFRIWYTKGFDAFAAYIDEWFWKMFSFIKRGAAFAKAPAKQKLKIIERKVAKASGFEKEYKELKKIPGAVKRTGMAQKERGKKTPAKQAKETTTTETLEQKEKSTAEKRYNEYFGSGANG